MCTTNSTLLTFNRVCFSPCVSDGRCDGHGSWGDGAGDQPPGGGGFCPVVPRKKTRGKAKNLKLDAKLRKTGRPLTLPIDTECTFHPFGKPCDYFTREVGIYMWRNSPLDRSGWKNVDQFEKTSLAVHLKAKFNLAQVEKDIHASKIEGGIQQVIQKRFSDRKHLKVNF
ncbi:hypothetical protein Hanom_Chr05g00465981 [Helianthus anomalus]